MSDTFDKWWQKDDRQGFAFERITLQGFAEENMQKAWNARQPEIDALKAEKLHLRTTLDEAFRISDTHIAEIHALRAENERLKALHDSLAEENRRLWLKAQDALVENERLQKDVGRYKYLRRWVRGETDLFTKQKTIHFFINPVGSGMKGSVAQHLDEAIDAALSALPYDIPEDGTRRYLIQKGE